MGCMPPIRFPIRLDPRARWYLRLFGVRGPDTAFVDLDETTLAARFGWARFAVPLASIERWRIEGPWSPFTALGIRMSIRHRDLTFGGSAHGGVRIDVRAGERVRLGPIRPPAWYLTVDDLDGLAAALAAAGIPGEDARTARR